MSEPKADNDARGRDASRPERDKDEFEASTGYRPSTNQTQDEPLPASHHDDGGQETARRSEPVRDNASPRGQDHEKESRGQDHEEE
jgi:hypothetical protein